ncbi:MAG: hypothetical protein EOP83_24455 [Verrucomicrobiaceae bacterium]|nr:MAG: hypothetical protein EOP83_24455 [Verrucomicrobiaceae bacterium]
MSDKRKRNNGNGNSNSNQPAASRARFLSLTGKRTSPETGFDWNVRSGLPKRVRRHFPEHYIPDFGYRNRIPRATWGDLTEETKGGIKGFLPDFDGRILNIARTGATMSTVATTQLEFVRRLCKLCSMIMQFNDIAAIKITGAGGAVEIAYCKQLNHEWEVFGGRPGHFRVWVHGVPAYQFRNDTFTSPEQVAQYLLPLAHGMERMRYMPLVYEAPSWRLVNEDIVT